MIGREEPMKAISSDRGDRVRARTGQAVVASLDRKTSERVAAAVEGGPYAVAHRIWQLDQEWNVDRALMANFAIVGGLSFALGIARVRPRRRWNGWLTLLTTQFGFLLGHAIVGWCPPLPVFRRLGFRTSKEIATERDWLVRQLQSLRVPT
jgi:hypothetical protein